MLSSFNLMNMAKSSKFDFTCFLFGEIYIYIRKVK